DRSISVSVHARLLREVTHANKITTKRRRKTKKNLRRDIPEGRRGVATLAKGHRIERQARKCREPAKQPDEDKGPEVRAERQPAVRNQPGQQADDERPDQ